MAEPLHIRQQGSQQPSGATLGCCEPQPCIADTFEQMGDIALQRLWQIGRESLGQFLAASRALQGLNDQVIREVASTTRETIRDSGRVDTGAVTILLGSR